MLKKSRMESILLKLTFTYYANTAKEQCYTQDKMSGIQLAWLVLAFEASVNATLDLTRYLLEY